MIGASQGQSEGEAGRGERGGSETDERGSDEPAGTTPEFDVVADSQEPGRPQAEVFTVDDGDNEALPVFSGEGEAKMFLWLTMPVSGWRVRDISVEELVSMLLGPCLGVGGVVLDPPPEILAEEADSLVSLSRDRFVDPAQDPIGCASQVTGGRLRSADGDWGSGSCPSKSARPTRLRRRVKIGVMRWKPFEDSLPLRR